MKDALKKAHLSHGTLDILILVLWNIELKIPLIGEYSKKFNYTFNW